MFIDGTYFDVTFVFYALYPQNIIKSALNVYKITTRAIKSALNFEKLAIHEIKSAQRTENLSSAKLTAAEK